MELGARVLPTVYQWPNVSGIAPRDIDLLCRYFSTKTMFGVKLGCDEEARQVLQACLTDPPIRHAVSSLRALREDLEASGDVPASIAQQSPSYGYGVQQYCMALGGLASNLSSPGSEGLTSALLCCRVFISIEQVRRNYVAMAQHITRGLGIMHENQARPVLVAAEQLLPARHDRLPFLDVFLIKLFAAPCHFAEPPATANVSGATGSTACPTLPRQQPVESCPLRTIAPDRRTELGRISNSTLRFLEKVSQLKSAANALPLRSEKTYLLDSLNAWFLDLKLVYTAEISDAEPIAVSFMRLFHQILTIIVLGALDLSPGRHAELRAENDRLQDMAGVVSERVKGYKHNLQPRIGSKDPSKAR